MNPPKNDDEAAADEGGYLQLALTQLRTRPWWGYTCLGVGAISAVGGGASLLSLLTGFDLTWISSLCAVLLMFLVLACFGCTLASRFVRESAPNNRPLVKLAGALMGGGLLCGLVSTLFSSNTGAANASKHLQVHRFDGERGQISVPGNWTMNAEVSKQTGSLALSDFDRDMHLSVSSVMRVDSVASSFDEFSSSAAARFKSHLKRPKVVETRHSASGRFPFNETQIDCVIDDTKARYLVRYIDCNDLWIEALVWAPVSTMQEHAQLGQQILNSIEPVQ